jgi:hypothetical protein
MASSASPPIGADKDKATDLEGLMRYPSAPTGKLQEKALCKIDCLNWTIRVFMVAGLVALVATIVLLGLTLARMVPPLSALYAFTGCIGTLVIAKIIDCIQQSIAKKAGLDLRAYYAHREPIPPPKPKKGKEVAKPEEKKSGTP